MRMSTVSMLYHLEKFNPKMEFKNGLWTIFVKEFVFSNENFVDLIKTAYLKIKES